MNTLHPNLRETLERIRLQLQLKSDEWTDILAMQPSEYRNAIDSGIGLTNRSVENLADALDLDPDAILSATVDFRALEAHRKGNIDYIPSRYSDVAFSKRRTSHYILEFVEREYGWRRKLEILRRLRLDLRTRSADRAGGRSRKSALEAAAADGHHGGRGLLRVFDCSVDGVDADHLRNLELASEASG